MNTGKILITLGIVTGTVVVCCKGANQEALSTKSPASKTAEAYFSLQWSRMRRLLNKSKFSPRETLSLAFYYLYAPDEDRLLALHKLNAVITKNSVPALIRRQAMLSYARGLELMQLRPKLYPEMNKLDDPLRIYTEIIKTYPESKEACYAIIYKTRRLLVRAKKSNDNDGNPEAFSGLEDFLAKPELRNRELIGDVFWFAGNSYIVEKRDYRKAVKSYIMADKYGIANPLFLNNIRFQIGRIYDIKLHDREKALKYYRRYIELYPSSNMALSVKKYMENLAAETIDNER